MPPVERKLLSVDFDGVLHSYLSGWRGVATIPDPPVPGAMAWLLDIVDVCDVAVFSSRSASWRGRRAMREWLQIHLARYMFNRVPPVDDKTRSRDAWDYCIGRAHTIVHRRLQWPKTKPPAWLTLDDRCMRFRGVFPNDFEILRFRPWNMRLGDGDETQPGV